MKDTIVMINKLPLKFSLIAILTVLLLSNSTLSSPQESSSSNVATVLAQIDNLQNDIKQLIQTQNESKEFAEEPSDDSSIKFLSNVGEKANKGYPGMLSKPVAGSRSDEQLSFARQKHTLGNLGNIDEQYEYNHVNHSNLGKFTPSTKAIRTNIGMPGIKPKKHLSFANSVQKKSNSVFRPQIPTKALKKKIAVSHVQKLEESRKYTDKTVPVPGAQKPVDIKAYLMPLMKPKEQARKYIEKHENIDLHTPCMQRYVRLMQSIDIQANVVENSFINQLKEFNKTCNRSMNMFNAIGPVCYALINQTNKRETDFISDIIRRLKIHCANAHLGPKFHPASDALPDQLYGYYSQKKNDPSLTSRVVYTQILCEFDRNAVTASATPINCLQFARMCFTTNAFQKLNRPCQELIDMCIGNKRGSCLLVPPVCSAANPTEYLAKFSLKSDKNMISGDLQIPGQREKNFKLTLDVLQDFERVLVNCQDFYKFIVANPYIDPTMAMMYLNQCEEESVDDVKPECENILLECSNNNNDACMMVQKICLEKKERTHNFFGMTMYDHANDLENFGSCMEEYTIMYNEHDTQSIIQFVDGCISLFKGFKANIGEKCMKAINMAASSMVDGFKHIEIQDACKSPKALVDIVEKKKLLKNFDVCFKKYDAALFESSAENADIFKKDCLIETNTSADKLPYAITFKPHCTTGILNCAETGEGCEDLYDLCPLPHQLVSYIKALDEFEECDGIYGNMMNIVDNAISELGSVENAINLISESAGPFNQNCIKKQAKIDKILPQKCKEEIINCATNKQGCNQVYKSCSNVVELRKAYILLDDLTICSNLYKEMLQNTDEHICRIFYHQCQQPLGYKMHFGLNVECQEVAVDCGTKGIRCHELAKECDSADRFKERVSHMDVKPIMRPAEFRDDMTVDEECEVYYENTVYNLKRIYATIFQKFCGKYQLVKKLNLHFSECQKTIESCQFQGNNCEKMQDCPSYNDLSKVNDVKSRIQGAKLKKTFRMGSSLKPNAKRQIKKMKEGSKKGMQQHHNPVPQNKDCYQDFTKLISEIQANFATQTGELIITQELYEKINGWFISCNDQPIMNLLGEPCMLKIADCLTMQAKNSSVFATHETYCSNIPVYCNITTPISLIEKENRGMSENISLNPKVPASAHRVNLDLSKIKVKNQKQFYWDFCKAWFMKIIQNTIKQGDVIEWYSACKKYPFVENMVKKCKTQIGGERNVIINSTTNEVEATNRSDYEIQGCLHNPQDCKALVTQCRLQKISNKFCKRVYEMAIETSYPLASQFYITVCNGFGRSGIFPMYGNVQLDCRSLMISCYMRNSNCDLLKHVCPKKFPEAKKQKPTPYELFKKRGNLGKVPNNDHKAYCSQMFRKIVVRIQDRQVNIEKLINNCQNTKQWPIWGKLDEECKTSISDCSKENTVNKSSAKSSKSKQPKNSACDNIYDNCVHFFALTYRKDIGYPMSTYENCEEVMKGILDKPSFAICNVFEQNCMASDDFQLTNIGYRTLDDIEKNNEECFLGIHRCIARRVFTSKQERDAKEQNITDQIKLACPKSKTKNWFNDDKNMPILESANKPLERICFDDFEELLQIKTKEIVQLFVSKCDETFVTMALSYECLTAIDNCDKKSLCGPEHLDVCDEMGYANQLVDVIGEQPKQTSESMETNNGRHPLGPLFDSKGKGVFNPIMIKLPRNVVEQIPKLPTLDLKCYDYFIKCTDYESLYFGKCTDFINECADSQIGQNITTIGFCYQNIVECSEALPELKHTVCRNLPESCNRIKELDFFVAMKAGAIKVTETDIQKKLKKVEAEKLPPLDQRPKYFHDNPMILRRIEGDCFHLYKFVISLENFENQLTVTKELVTTYLDKCQFTREMDSLNLFPGCVPALAACRDQNDCVKFIRICPEFEFKTEVVKSQIKCTHLYTEQLGISKTELHGKTTPSKTRESMPPKVNQSRQFVSTCLNKINPLTEHLKEQFPACVKAIHQCMNLICFFVCPTVCPKINEHQFTINKTDTVMHEIPSFMKGGIPITNIIDQRGNEIVAEEIEPECKQIWESLFAPMHYKLLEPPTQLEITDTRRATPAYIDSHKKSKEIMSYMAETDQCHKIVKRLKESCGPISLWLKHGPYQEDQVDKEGKVEYKQNWESGNECTSFLNGLEFNQMRAQHYTCSKYHFRQKCQGFARIPGVLIRYTKDINAPVRNNMNKNRNITNVGIKNENEEPPAFNPEMPINQYCSKLFEYVIKFPFDRNLQFFVDFCQKWMEIFTEPCQNHIELCAYASYNDYSSCGEIFHNCQTELKCLKENENQANTQQAFETCFKVFKKKEHEVAERLNQADLNTYLAKYPSGDALVYKQAIEQYPNCYSKLLFMKGNPELTQDDCRNFTEECHNERMNIGPICRTAINRCVINMHQPTILVNKKTAIYDISESCAIPTTDELNCNKMMYWLMANPGPESATKYNELCSEFLDNAYYTGESCKANIRLCRKNILALSGEQNSGLEEVYGKNYSLRMGNITDLISGCMEIPKVCPNIEEEISLGKLANVDQKFQKLNIKIGYYPDNLECSRLMDEKIINTSKKRIETSVCKTFIKKCGEIYRDALNLDCMAMIIRCADGIQQGCKNQATKTKSKRKGPKNTMCSGYDQDQVVDRHAEFLKFDQESQNELDEVIVKKRLRENSSVNFRYVTRINKAEKKFPILKPYLQTQLGILKEFTSNRNELEQQSIHVLECIELYQKYIMDSCSHKNVEEFNLRCLQSDLQSHVMQGIVEPCLEFIDACSFDRSQCRDCIAPKGPCQPYNSKKISIHHENLSGTTAITTSPEKAHSKSPEISNLEITPTMTSKSIQSAQNGDELGSANAAKSSKSNPVAAIKHSEEAAKHTDQTNSSNKGISVPTAPVIYYD